MDKMSSAHVYLRMRKGQTIDDISEGLLEDCAQLVKANSIQGKSIFLLTFYYYTDTKQLALHHFKVII